MANEINIQATLAFARDVVGLQAVGSKTISQSPGTKGILNQAAVTTTASKLIDSAASPVGSLGILFVKSLDTNSASVDLSLDGSTQVYSTLKPGEFCLIPINKTTVQHIWAKASAGSAAVLFAVAEI